MPELLISNVQLKSAQISNAESGLLGWVSCSINGSLRLDGIAVRRTAGGRLALSFPARTDSRGGRHPIVRPLDDEIRRAIEAAVLGALEKLEGVR